MDTKPNPIEGSPKGNTLTLRTESFKHELLDHSKASIRLLQICADLSRDGLIQCSLTHTTINETPYSCLSYRWGEPLPSWRILINGRPYHVGGNLYDFLDTFRQSTLNQAKESIWIDALCIAQDDVLERNHQVTQMGEIFSTAKSVYVWLGKMPSIAPIVSSLKNWQNPTYEDLGIVRSDLLSRYLYHNEYWNRAWITQEFLLARHAIVFLDSEPMGLPDLLDSMKSFYLLAGDSYKSSSFSQHVDSSQESDIVTGLPLVSLLGHFRKKRCTLAQDRIFSLLSLCSSSSRIVVEYDKDAVILARNILANSPAPLCLCEIMTVLHYLDLLVNPEIETADEADTMHNAWEGIYVEIDLNGVQLPDTLHWRHMPLSGQLLEYRGLSICPVVDDVVVSCARKMLDTSLTTDHGLKSYITTRDIPFVFQRTRLDLAQKMCQSGSSVLTIETADPTSPQYTLRIPMHSMVNTLIESRGHCSKSERGATWCDREGKDLLSEKDKDAFKKIWSAPGHSYLKLRMSFEDCCAVYELLDARVLKYSGWTRYSWSYSIDNFLEDLSKHLRGEATILRREALEEAIKKVGQSMPSVTRFGYGPCRFVCPRDSTEE
jgi:hypothetical protein